MDGLILPYWMEMLCLKDREEFYMIDSLIEKIQEKKNPTVAGLDPKLDYLPEEW